MLTIWYRVILTLMAGFLSLGRTVYGLVFIYSFFANAFFLVSFVFVTPGLTLNPFHILFRHPTASLPPFCGSPRRQPHTNQCRHREPRATAAADYIFVPGGRLTDHLHGNPCQSLVERTPILCLDMLCEPIYIDLKAAPSLAYLNHHVGEPITRHLLLLRMDWSSPFSSTAAAASLLPARRPSWAPSLPSDLRRRLRLNNDMDSESPIMIDSSAPQYNTEHSPPDDGGNFSRSLQIDMKSLVGDAVGNVRVSLLLFPGIQDIRILLSGTKLVKED
jgi:hypothetical protein